MSRRDEQRKVEDALWSLLGMPALWRSGAEAFHVHKPRGTSLRGPAAWHVTDCKTMVVEYHADYWR